MEFIIHAVSWCKGEIFEGRMFLLFGLAVLGVSFACSKIGTTPSSKAMFAPLLVVALIAIAGGVFMNISNINRRY